MLHQLNEEETLAFDSGQMSQTRKIGLEDISGIVNQMGLHGGGFEAETDKCCVDFYDYNTKENENESMLHFDTLDAAIDEDELSKSNN